MKTNSSIKWTNKDGTVKDLDEVLGGISLIGDGDISSGGTVLFNGASQYLYLSRAEYATDAMYDTPNFKTLEVIVSGIVNGYDIMAVILCPVTSHPFGSQYGPSTYYASGGGTTTGYMRDYLASYSGKLSISVAEWDNGLEIYDSYYNADGYYQNNVYIHRVTVR